jgi:hypothetical protein
MLKEAKMLHDSVKEMYAEMLPLITLLEQKSATDHDSYGKEQVDTAYACRETINMLQDMEKKINKVTKAAALVANYYMKAAEVTKITTDHCTATAKVKLWFKIPYKREKDPDFYDDLQRYAGVRQEMFHRELVRIHPPNLMDALTEDIGNGNPVPVDPAKVQDTSFELVCRRKKDV